MTTKFDHILKQVSQDVIENIPAISSQKKHRSKYNIACWIRFNSAIDTEIQLELRAQDQQQIQAIVIDSIKSTGTQQILLSGQASILCQGKIQSMQLVLTSKEQKLNYEIDEAFIQKAVERPPMKQPARHLYQVA